jgi:hypothetical protein
MSGPVGVLVRLQLVHLEASASTIDALAPVAIR